MSEPSLVRRIGYLSATALVISNMIGVGIFTTTGFLARDLGSPALVIGIWFLGAILALLGAVCYAELSVNLPRSGGEYVYLTEAWGPAWGFVDGWVSFFAGFSAPIAAAALAIAAYLAHLFPSLASHNPEGQISLGFLTLHLGPAQLFACGLVVLFTVLNFFNVSQVARLQNVLTGTKLAVIGAFLVLGFAAGDGSWEHFSQAAERASTNPLVAQLAVSLVFVYWGYSGWNAAVYVAEEIKDPERVLPVSLISGTVLVAILFAGLNFLYVYAVPLHELQGVVAVGAKASEGLFGPEASGAFSVAMAVGLLATVNAMCMIGPRVYYAMAKQGAFFPAAAKVHPRWQSPWVAVLFQGICCCVLIITGTFESLGYYIGFTLFLFAALSVAALFKFRRRPEWKRLPWVNFGYPLAPALFIGANAWVFLYFATEKSWEAVASVATVLGGAIVYHLYRRRLRAPAGG